MIGIINDGLRSFVIDTYGADAWDAIVSATGVDKNFVSACPYPDEVTYSALACLAEQQQQDPQDVLERCGYYFGTVYVRRMGYERLLRCMGANLVEFLQNLNIYHIHLSMTFKEMKPPAFRVDDATPESIIFHYSSQRSGLTRFAIGLLRGAVKLLYDTDVEISVLRYRGEDDCGGGDSPPFAVSGEGGGGGAAAAANALPADGDTFLIRFPPVAALMEQHNAAATCRLALDPPTLFQLFPFHLVLDSECRLVQVGRALSRLYPGMKPGRLLTDFFSLRHPYIPVTFERLLDASDNLFVLRSCVNGMELKGQVQYLQMPAGHPERGPLAPAVASSTSATAGTSHAPMPLYPSFSGTGTAAAAAAAAVIALGAVAEESSPHGFSDSTYSVPTFLSDPNTHTLNHNPTATTTTTTASHPPAQQRTLSPQPLPPQQSPCQPSRHRQQTKTHDFMAASVAQPPQQQSDPSQAPPPSASAPLNACPHFAGLFAHTTTSGSGAPPSSQSQRSSASGGGLWSRAWQRLHPAGGETEPVLLFLGSPRIASVEEMRAYSLFVSDLPLWDASREAVLFAEQRSAEAAMRDTFERLSLQLEEERHRSDQLLYQMIPRHIADSLRRGQRVNAETYPEATILFSDVVNFTTISAGSTAMEVCNMLDDLYNEFDALVDEYPEVYKVETIGDAYMLVANVTQPCPDHVDVVLDFALDMQRVANRVTTNRGAPIQIRVGVHTGSVVGGVVGRKMPRFHLFGDAVNTASRMESHGLAGAVHISAASRALIRNPSKYLISERGEILVKGKGMMETFLVSRADAPSTAHLLSILASTNPDLAAVYPAVRVTVQSPSDLSAIHHIAEAAASVPRGRSGIQTAAADVVHAAAGTIPSDIRQPSEISIGGASMLASTPTITGDAGAAPPLSPHDSLFDITYELQLALKQVTEAIAATIPPEVPSPAPPLPPPSQPVTGTHSRPDPTLSLSPFHLAGGPRRPAENPHLSSKYYRSFPFRSRSSVEDSPSEAAAAAVLATGPATASGSRSASLTPTSSMRIRVPRRPRRPSFYLRLGTGTVCSSPSQADLGDLLQHCLSLRPPSDPSLQAAGQQTPPDARQAAQIPRILSEPPIPYPDEFWFGEFHAGAAIASPNVPDEQLLDAGKAAAEEAEVAGGYISASFVGISSHLAGLTSTTPLPLPPDSTLKDLPPLPPPPPAVAGSRIGSFVGLLPTMSQLTPPGQLPAGAAADSIYVSVDEDCSESLHRLARRPEDYEDWNGYGI